MHYSLLLCIALILVVSMLVMLGQRLRISYPIFLVLGGLAISFIPGLPSITIDPELIFLIFLPPLLFEAAWMTSWKAFWKWRRVITMLAFGFVLITSTVVAFVSTALIPGFTLAMGFLLGAIISPPDAVAATSVLKGINIPKPLTQILEGESLVNDASSLIVFRFALAAIMTGTFVFQKAAVSFVLVAVMGVVIGLAIALIIYAMYRWLPTTTSIDIALSFIAPYLMYLTAESFHYSGVMAVVSGGLFLSYHSHVTLSHQSRLQGYAMWNTITFILNGLVFMLIGLEMPEIMRNLGDYSKGQAIFYGVVISLVIIVTRIITALFTAGWTKLIGRWITVADQNPGWRGPIVIGWAGMRGVVSLASALSIPLLLKNGQPFPYRSLILCITFIVILITLVLQGLTLPWVIKLVGLDKEQPASSEQEEEAKLHHQLLTAAVSHLEEQYTDLMKKQPVLQNLYNQMKNDLQLTANFLEGHGAGEKERHSSLVYNSIYLELLGTQRQRLFQLRDRDQFEDELIRKVEGQLDLEQEKLLRENGHGHH
ncbi:Na+/H+ antiporter [Pseudobacter ginsenosidimutans]|uniref:Sodium/proton antiporter (CPA1 family) n=1 Tax=Pseudobacter ginsenosidimutans TaxID=661488 RepID=A0A4Q7MSF3_9BACT|nr:Na+/H+ antiporter [Pseudobacter ginsenosidimutans]QEC41486.1 Na+/H+ antiporter [Pseudobacter ginsenosidimutans]RZS71732.1 sodium/proton antiporter (CPA1 family) [Pseudobacter ginsenosidimutans]